jgi:hypothetical protein
LTWRGKFARKEVIIRCAWAQLDCENQTRGERFFFRNWSALSPLLGANLDRFIAVRNKYLAVANPDIASDGDRRDIKKLVLEPECSPYVLPPRCDLSSIHPIARAANTGARIISNTRGTIRTLKLISGTSSNFQGIATLHRFRRTRVS